MIWHFSQADEELGRRVADGLSLDYAAVRA
jgi:hypothetical protein